jgi:pilus assembly protein Flp/PilA
MKRFLRDQSGATAIEYALIAGLIAMAIVSATTMIGTSLKGSYEQVSSGFSSR